MSKLITLSGNFVSSRFRRQDVTDLFHKARSNKNRKMLIEKLDEGDRDDFFDKVENEFCFFWKKTKHCLAFRQNNVTIYDCEELF